MKIQSSLAAAPIATADPIQADQCPRCQQPLIDPSGLGWCKACGFCRSLEAEQHNQLLQAPARPTQGEVLAGAAQQIPWWFWSLIAGIGVLGVISMAADRLLPAGLSLPRALWTSIQIVLGLILILAGQFIALVKIAYEDANLSFKDALVPTRLWPLAAKRMSRLYGCLWTSVWGLSLVVFAFLFVGGLGHWFSYLPGAKNAPPSQKARR